MTHSLSRTAKLALFLLLIAALPSLAFCQSTVPLKIRANGTLLDSSAEPISAGTVSVTFSTYSAQTGGTALWTETQNVAVDAQGKYTVVLGATGSVPANLFGTGE